MRQTALVAIIVLLLLPVTGVGTAGAAGVNPTAQSTDCSFPLTVTDATGTQVTVQNEPERIVTLAPSAAQTMWEIGGREKVVGVSRYASYLEGADSRTIVSGSGESFVSVETVVGTEPDLVLAPSVVPDQTVEKLRNAGVTVYKFRPQHTIDRIETKTRSMGRLTGECAGAERTIEWMHDELATVRQATEGQDRPRVLYVFNGYTAGNGTFIDDVIETAGGRNVAAANGDGFYQLNQETVVATDPEWIVVNDGSPTVPQTPAYNQTTAIQQDQVVVLRENYLSQSAPRTVQTVLNLTKALHPDAYREAAEATERKRPANGTNQTNESRETAGNPTASSGPEGGSTGSTTGTMTGTTGTTTPGLGAAGVTLALLGTALLVGRFRRE